MSINTIQFNDEILNKILDLVEDQQPENMITGITGGDYIDIETIKTHQNDESGDLVKRVLYGMTFTDDAKAILNTPLPAGNTTGNDYILVNSGNIENGFDILNIQDILNTRYSLPKMYKLPSIESYEQSYSLVAYESGSILQITNDTLENQSVEDGNKRILVTYNGNNQIPAPMGYFVEFRNLTAWNVSVEWDIPQQASFYNRIGYVAPLTQTINPNNIDSISYTINNGYAFQGGNDPTEVNMIMV